MKHEINQDFIADLTFVFHYYPTLSLSSNSCMAMATCLSMVWSAWLWNEVLLLNRDARNCRFEAVRRALDGTVSRWEDIDMA